MKTATSRHLGILPLLVGLLLLADPFTRTAARAAQQPATSEISQLTPRSSLIFLGQVEKLAASNLRILPANEQTAVVRILEVFSAIRSVSIAPGDHVTLLLLAGSPVRPGDRNIFFANGWLYGDNLAVREVGHVAIEKSGPQVKQEIADAQRKADDEKIASRIAAAELVVFGRVQAVKRFETNDARRAISEHDPEWWLAEVRVETVLKGPPPKGLVLVAYPTSDDVMWLHSPKFRSDQAGIWILARLRGIDRTFAKMEQPVYTALDPHDFRDASEMARIQRLVKPGQ
jgi:hypothetical protein